MNKAQVALEYLIVVGLIVAILTPFWVYVSLYSTDIEFGFKTEYARTAVNRITDASDFINAQGVPAKVRLRIYFPKGIDSTSVSGKKVTITLSGNPIYSESIADLIGDLPTSSGYHYITIKSEEDYVNITC